MGEVFGFFSMENLISRQLRKRKENKEGMRGVLLKSSRGVIIIELDMHWLLINCLGSLGIECLRN